MHFICSIELACFLDSALNCLWNDENGNLPPNVKISDKIFRILLRLLIFVVF